MGKSAEGETLSSDLVAEAIRRAHRDYGNGDLYVTLDDFLAFTVAEVQAGAGIVAEERCFGGETCLYLDQENDGHYQFGLSLRFLADGRVDFSFLLDYAIPYEEAQARAIAEATLADVSASVESITPQDGTDWGIEGFLNDMSVTVGDLVERRIQLQAGLCVVRSGGSRDGLSEVLHKLLSRRFDELIGQSETSWLEFKHSLNLDSPGGKAALAREVSAFANSERAALLVVGFETARVNHRDTVVAVAPMKAAGQSVERYQQIIDTRVFPLVRGIQIHVLEVDGGGAVVAIVVPAQRETDKPFFVLEGDGTRFLVARRRGEGIVNVSAREIHGTLSAARRIVRGTL